MVLDKKDYNILACPNCLSSLKLDSKIFSCSKCRKRYEMKEGVPIFIKSQVSDENMAVGGFNRNIKEYPKLISALRKLKKILGPPLTIYAPKEKEFVNQITKKSKRSLNIGSSSKKAYPGSLNLDIGFFENVDIVADGKRLPFKENSFDLILIESVLEHVDEPEKIINESYRAMKKGGKIYISIPFVYAFHGSPDDYERYTLHGLKKRIENAGFITEKEGIIAGPSSTFNQILRYYLAMLFSFNNDFLFSIFLNIFGWLTFPIKYLDSFLVKNKKAHVISSIIYVLGRK